MKKASGLLRIKPGKKEQMDYGWSHRIHPWMDFTDGLWMDFKESTQGWIVVDGIIHLIHLPGTAWDIDKIHQDSADGIGQGGVVTV